VALIDPDAWEGAPLDGVVLIDPTTRKPYTAAFTQTVIQGGEIDVTDLSKEGTQQQVLTAIQALPQSGGTQDVEIQNSSLPLPAGASTAEYQQAANTALLNIYTQLGAGVPVTLQDASIAATIASLPLPEGAATSALQQSLLNYLQSGSLTTSITGSVSAVISSLPPVSLASGQSVGITGPVTVATASGSPLSVTGSVSLADNDVDATIVGPVTLAGSNTAIPVTDGGGSLTIDGNVGINGAVIVNDGGGNALNSATADPAPNARGLVVRAIPTGVQPVSDAGGSLTTDTAQLPTTLGAKTAANSLAVTLPSDQGALAVADNGGSLTTDTPQLPASLGTKSAAASLPVVLASDQAVLQVADNAGSLTVDSPQLPASLGTKTASASLPVVLASDQAILRTVPGNGADVLTNVTSSATSVTLVAANPNRRKLVIYNNSTAILNINTSGGTASATTGSSTRIAANQTWESPSPVTTTAVTGIWVTANGTAQITEQ
jgi:hypothetical protein